MALYLLIAMSYCENCGSPLGPNAKFCGNCGTAAKKPDPAPAEKPKETKSTSKKASAQQPKRERLSYYSPPTGRPIPQALMPIISSQPQAAQPYTPVVAAPIYQAPPEPQPQPQMPPAYVAQPQNSTETTVGVILFRKPKSLGRYDTYTGVVTSERLIFAQMTSQMLNDAAMQARDKAKAEGKGFFGQWGDQLKSTLGYINRYLNMPPEAILAETPGNFAIPNNTVNEVKIHLKNDYNDNQRRELEAEIKTSSGNYKYNMDENSDFTDTLKRVYGDRVRMPFGYFSKSLNIKF